MKLPPAIFAQVESCPLSFGLVDALMLLGASYHPGPGDFLSTQRLKWFGTD